MKKQQGSAVFLLMLAFFMAFVSIAVSKLSVNQLRLKQQQKEFQVLTHAKQALIDYALINAGLYPCPDTDGDGEYNGTSCCAGCSANAGDLPWKELQLNELKDSKGNPIQYQHSPISISNGSLTLTIP